MPWRRRNTDGPHEHIQRTMCLRKGLEDFPNFRGFGDVGLIEKSLSAHFINDSGRFASRGPMLVEMKPNCPPLLTKSLTNGSADLSRSAKNEDRMELLPSHMLIVEWNIDCVAIPIL